MNIFKHRDSFLGCLNSSAAEDSLLPLFQLAKQIKLRLGKQGYLLDCYLSLIFEALSSGVSYDAADEGVQAGGDSQGFFFSLLDGTEPEHPHPLGERMREVYNRQADTLAYQERYTKLCMLLFPVADELMTQAATDFIKKKINGLNGVVDEIRLQELFEQIAHLAGESMLEELNAKIRQRFLIAPMAPVFAQGMTDDLLCRLISRDHETSRQMFQLLLDSMPDTL